MEYYIAIVQQVSKPLSLEALVIESAYRAGKIIILLLKLERFKYNP